MFCLSLCLCLSNISLLIALLVLSTIMLLNFSFLLLVYFLCASWASVFFVLNYCLNTFSESPIFPPSSLSLPHIFTELTHLQQHQFSKIHLLAIFNHWLLKLIQNDKLLKVKSVTDEYDCLNLTGLCVCFHSISFSQPLALKSLELWSWHLKDTALGQCSYPRDINH